jgi:hypothetical protein
LEAALLYSPNPLSVLQETPFARARAIISLASRIYEFKSAFIYIAGINSNIKSLNI